MCTFRHISIHFTCKRLFQIVKQMNHTQKRLLNSSWNVSHNGYNNASFPAYKLNKFNFIRSITNNRMFAPSKHHIRPNIFDFQHFSSCARDATTTTTIALAKHTFLQWPKHLDTCGDACITRWKVHMFGVARFESPYILLLLRGICIDLK